MLPLASINILLSLFIVSQILESKMPDRILTHPNKLLRRKTTPIKPNPMDMIRITNMFKLMYKSSGIGLAAPQIGWNARLFILDVKDENSGQLVFVNPTILDRTGNIIEMTEGCLSLPGQFGAVDRHENVFIEAFDLKGKKFRVDASGLIARCILHEYDHLDGILYIDHAKKLYRSETDVADV